jgi:plastocyanin
MNPEALSLVDPQVFTHSRTKGVAMRDRNRLQLAVAGIMTMAVLMSACSSSSGSDSSSGSEGDEGSSGTITLNGQTANDHGTKDVSGGGAEEVEVDSFYFNPTVFTAHAGDKLTLTLSNESSALHNFSLPDQNIDMDVPADESITVTVVFPDSGTQVFFCKYHQSKGMLGGLEVETN